MARWKSGAKVRNNWELEIRNWKLFLMLGAFCEEMPLFVISWVHSSFCKLLIPHFSQSHSHKSTGTPFHLSRVVVEVAKQRGVDHIGGADKVFGVDVVDDGSTAVHNHFWEMKRLRSLLAVHLDAVAVEDDDVVTSAEPTWWKYLVRYKVSIFFHFFQKHDGSMVMGSKG